MFKKSKLLQVPNERSIRTHSLSGVHFLPKHNYLNIRSYSSFSMWPMCMRKSSLMRRRRSIWRAYSSPSLSSVSLSRWRTACTRVSKSIRATSCTFIRRLTKGSGDYLERDEGTLVRSRRWGASWPVLGIVCSWIFSCFLFSIYSSMIASLYALYGLIEWINWKSTVRSMREKVVESWRTR